MTKRAAVTRQRAGFTLLEVIVAIGLASIVMAGVIALMVSQSRAYQKGLVNIDSSETLRGAGALIAWEVRHAEMANDVVANYSADTLSLRSVQGVGTICAKSVISTLVARYEIWKQGGDIQATTDDSALIYSPGTQQWQRLKITAVGTPAAMGIAACTLAGGRSPDIVVEVSWPSTTTASAAALDMANIQIGSMFRSFRRTRFAEYQEGGRYWLGRKVGAGAWEKVTGPILSPASGGLSFAYYDSTGAVTTGDIIDPVTGDATVVRTRSIGLTLRSQSYKMYAGNTGAAPYRQDTVKTRIMLRQ